MSALAQILEMEALLRSDLYKHVQPSDPEIWAQAMESPLKWRVEWVIRGRTEATPGAGARVVARIADPRGKEFAWSEDATIDWLAAVLP